MSSKKPSHEFLDSLKSDYAAKSLQVQRLERHLLACKAVLVDEAKLIDQVENFIKTEEFALEEMAARVSAAIEGGEQGNHPTASAAFSTSIFSRTEGRKPRRKSPLKSESDRIRSFAMDVLNGAGKALSGPQILDGIRERGYVFTSKNPTELLKKALKDAPEFTRHGRGYWLADMPLPTNPDGGHAEHDKKRLPRPGKVTVG